ncbi:MAG: hypothetical protein ACLQGV_10480, partial [Bryobacteraceae bacterium]
LPQLGQLHNFAEPVRRLLNPEDKRAVLCFHQAVSAVKFRSSEDLWRAGNQLTEAEAAFRVHKSGLAIHPVWRQKEDRVQAHIPVCFLTCALWKTLAASCREAGLGDQPRQVFEARSEIAMVGVGLPARSAQVVRKRCISQPTEHQWILHRRLGLRLPAALEKAAM